MSAEQQHFEELKRLLAAKREAPPSPSFFDRMSENIKDRLQHPPAEQPPTWWERFREDIDVKACLVGILACGLVLYAMLAAMRRSQGPVIVFEESSQKLTPPSVVVVKTPPVAPATEAQSSTTPVIHSGATNVTTAPAAFSR
jgi:hypothetical protein